MHKILIHYGELSLKGGNRRAFERQLEQNLRRQFQPQRIVRQFGRMLLDVEQADEAFMARLALIPGIRNFARFEPCGRELAEMQAKGLEMVRALLGGDTEGRRFRVDAKRADKSYPLTSVQLNFEVGGFIKQELNLTVDLDHPEATLHIELARDCCYLFTDNRQGTGGLPVGSSGRGVVLLSGGIDSPVAAYTMIKRGMQVDLVHLYNSTLNRDFAKIRRLAAKLSLYQPRVRLFLIDLEEFQRHAIAHVPARYRMIIYKRQMIRAASAVAAEVGAQALVTGDSLGQVASQTLANIHAIYDATDLPLLPPLIGMDKEEIIRIGEKIGTFAISIEEYCDICAYMIDKHPETSGKREEVARLESLLPLRGDGWPRKIEQFIDGAPMVRESHGED